MDSIVRISEDLVENDKMEEERKRWSKDEFPKHIVCDLENYVGGRAEIEDEAEGSQSSIYRGKIREISLSDSRDIISIELCQCEKLIEGSRWLACGQDCLKISVHYYAMRKSIKGLVFESRIFGKKVEIFLKN